jgi:hypothetical protein
VACCLSGVTVCRKTNWRVRRLTSSLAGVAVWVVLFDPDAWDLFVLLAGARPFGRDRPFSKALLNFIWPDRQRRRFTL